MVQALLIVALIVCAFGWFVRYLSNAALLYWMVTHGQEIPGKEDIQESAVAVLKHWLRMDRHRQKFWRY